MDAEGTAAPVALEVDAAERVANWRPLVHWLLSIPHWLIVAVLATVAYVIVIIVWFAVLFTKKSPPGLSAFLAMMIRYDERVNSYLLCMHEEYPPFEFEPSLEDPGSYPTRTDFQVDPEMSRWLVFVKWLLLIPHFIVLWLVGIAELFVLFIAFFAVLFTGRWPSGMLGFVNNVRRWNLRVAWYLLMQTDTYPPFKLS